MRIQSSGGLSEKDIEHIIKEAESHRESDQKMKEVVEAKNQAESVLYDTEKNVKQYLLCYLITLQVVVHVYY